jgi:hypothetical protein
MIGTGFIKCIPITFSGRVVTDAILVIEIEEVLVAKIASLGET